MAGSDDEGPTLRPGRPVLHGTGERGQEEGRVLFLDWVQLSGVASVLFFPIVPPSHWLIFKT